MRYAIQSHVHLVQSPGSADGTAADTLLLAAVLPRFIINSGSISINVAYNISLIYENYTTFAADIL